MKIKNDMFYLIRHKPSGLLKGSGCNPTFNKTGKLWRGSGVKSHLRLFELGPSSWDNTLLERLDKLWVDDIKVEDCEIVEIELHETQNQSLKDFIEKEMNYGCK